MLIISFCFESWFYIYYERKNSAASYEAIAEVAKKGNDYEGIICTFICRTFLLNHKNIKMLRNHIYRIKEEMILLLINNRFGSLPFPCPTDQLLRGKPIAFQLHPNRVKSACSCTTIEKPIHSHNFLSDSTIEVSIKNYPHIFNSLLQRNAVNQHKLEPQ